MAFEFILLALIEGQASVEVSKYEDATAFYCLQDATKLNSYIRNQYVKVEDLSSVKEMFLNRVSDYEKKYGPFPSFTEETLNFGTPEAEAFYQEMSSLTYPMGELPENMSVQQKMDFSITARIYLTITDRNEENAEHMLFKEMLNSDEDIDLSTMLSSDQVRYVCLPTPS